MQQPSYIGHMRIATSEGFVRTRAHIPSLRGNSWGQLAPEDCFYVPPSECVGGGGGGSFLFSVFPPVPVIFIVRIPVVINYDLWLELLDLLQQPPYLSGILPFPQPGEAEGRHVTLGICF